MLRIELALDHITGNITKDSSGNGRDATCTGVDIVPDPTGRFSACAAFDGETSTITVPDMACTLDFTFSAWIRTDPGNTFFYATIIAFGRGIPFFGLYQGQPRLGNILSLEETIGFSWRHLAVTQAPSGVTLYLDGRRAASLSSRSGTTGIGLSIGRNAATKSSGFKGFLARVAIFDEALSEHEIASFMASSASRERDITLKSGPEILILRPPEIPFDPSAADQKEAQTNSLAKPDSLPEPTSEPLSGLASELEPLPKGKADEGSESVPLLEAQEVVELEEEEEPPTEPNPAVIDDENSLIEIAIASSPLIEIEADVAIDSAPVTSIQPALEIALRPALEIASLARPIEDVYISPILLRVGDMAFVYLTGEGGQGTAKLSIDRRPTGLDRKKSWSATLKGRLELLGGTIVHDLDDEVRFEDGIEIALPCLTFGEAARGVLRLEAGGRSELAISLLFRHHLTFGESSFETALNTNLVAILNGPHFEQRVEFSFDFLRKEISVSVSHDRPITSLAELVDLFERKAKSTLEEKIFDLREGAGHHHKPGWLHHEVMEVLGTLADLLE